MPLRETELAYIAGIIDGEGSISLVRSHAKRTRGRYVYPLVRIANTDRRLIDWLEERLGGARQYTSAMNERCRPCHHLAWASNEAYEILEAVLPYLVIKRGQANLALGLLEKGRIAQAKAGGKFGHGRPIPDALMEEREAAFFEMQRLNGRGKDAVN